MNQCEYCGLYTTLGKCQNCGAPVSASVPIQPKQDINTNSVYLSNLFCHTCGNLLEPVLTMLNSFDGGTGKRRYGKEWKCPKESKFWLFLRGWDHSYAYIYEDIDGIENPITSKKS